MPVVGDRCRVMCPLRPTGLVEFAGTRRDARTVGGPLDAGADAVVVGWDAFGLIVKRPADVPYPKDLPGYGEPVPSPDELVALRDADARRVKADELEDVKHEAGEGVALVGLVAAIAAGLGYLVAGPLGAGVGGGLVLVVAVGVAASAFFGAGS